MNAPALYRAVYQRTDGSLRPRRMTFAADDAAEAVTVAEDWQLPSDRLLVVKRVRPLVVQLSLTPQEAQL